MSDTKEKYKLLKKQMTDLRNQIEEQAKEFFKDASKDLFEKHPNLEEFSWSQYTPYFNDGEECTFSANTEYIKITMSANAASTTDDEDDDDSDFDSYDVKGKRRSEYTEREAAGVDALALLAIFEEDDYKAMFGDHVEVTVSRRGVGTDEYSHD